MSERILIVPDRHHQVDIIEDYIQSSYPTEVIFLGDYFDDWNDYEKQVEHTATWLKQSLGWNNRIHLLGNHDISYMSHNTALCSGWTEHKQDIIDKIICPDEWKKMKLFEYRHGYLLSHAGIHPSIFSHPILGINEDQVTSMCNKAIFDLESGIVNPVLNSGHARGGPNRIGGILWLDWNHEFITCYDSNNNEIKQIVGHTAQFEPRQKDSSWCLDTQNKNYVGWLIDSKFSVQKI